MSKDIIELKKERDNLNVLALYNRHNGWWHFLQKLPKATTNSDFIRECYEEFLKMFPFSHNHWNKYALYESSLQEENSRDKALKIFQRAIRIIKNNPNIWICYCNWAQKAYKDDETSVRKIYEQSFKQIGWDYNSLLLWENYINFEISKNQTMKANQVFMQVILLPIKNLMNIKLRYQQFLNEISDEDVQKVIEQRFGEGKFKKTPIVNKKKILVQSFIKQMQKSTQKASIRGIFEDQIRELEFSGKKFLASEYKLWQQYLDNVKADHYTSKTVYEKAIISQPDNTDLWLKFFIYLESKQDFEHADKLFKDFKGFFVVLDFIMLFYWKIDYEETRQNYDKASNVLRELQNQENPKIQNFIREIQMRSRIGEYAKVCMVFERALQKFSSNDYITVFLLQEYAFFLWKRIGSIQTSIDVFRKRSDKIVNVEGALETYLNFLINVSVEDDDVLIYIIEIFELALKDMPESRKKVQETTINVFLKIVREYCSDIKIIKAIEKKYLENKSEDYDILEKVLPVLQKRQGEILDPLEAIKKLKQ